jgi:hypothetical protein
MKSNEIYQICCILMAIVHAIGTWLHRYLDSLCLIKLAIFL